MPQRSSSSARVFYPEHDTAELVSTLRERLGDLKGRLPLTRAVLFGSYARGEYTAASDVDVLLVYEGEERPDAYALSKRILKIRRLEPHLYTEDQYRAMGDTVRRMIKGGIPLL
jgi:predicted nucleotidyltransferase